MRRSSIKEMSFIVSFCIAGLVGCSGDGGVDGSGEKPQVLVDGTAATGKPIANASVIAKTNSGAKTSATTNGLGKFSLSVNEDEGPYLLRAEHSSGKYLFSIASSQGITNIHPITDLIIRNWFKVQGLDVESEFDASGAAVLLPSVTDINKVKAAIKNILSLTLQEFSLPENFDLVSTSFDADNSGFDRYLDHIKVIIINNFITFVIKDPVTNFEYKIISNIAVNTDLTSEDVANPEDPANVRAIPVNTSEMVVVWEPSIDNIGVVGYNVYRNAQLLATTPFPVFSDSGLSLNVDYCYEVEAFDSAGLMSAKVITPVCPQTTGSIDATPPSAPTNVNATATGSSSVDVLWTQSGIGDVFGFDIYRGLSGSVSAKVASVSATSYSDFSLLSDTEYCYSVVAYDAAGNESIQSFPEACARTELSTTPPPMGTSNIEFSSATYQGSEADATVLITVNRNGSVSEQVSVDYNVSDGTAIGGQDFASASGTLTWPANDSSPRSIYVHIKGDTDNAESNETVLLSITNPSLNTALGSISSSILTIVNSDCTGVLDADITVDTTISNPCTVVSSAINIDGGLNNPKARLQVNRGVTLVFLNNAGFNVKANGALTAVGDEQNPILFTGANKSPGEWRGIQFSSSGDARNEFAHVTIEYARNAPNGEGMLTLFGTASTIKIRNSILQHGSFYGFDFDNNARVTEFSNNIVTNNASGPGLIDANMVSALDAGSQYTGNGIDGDQDKVSVFGVNVDATIDTKAQTWAALDVPYLINSYVRIGKDLSIDAGARLFFAPNAGFNVRTDGSLKAIGNMTNNILFTQDTQGAGGWSGIQFSTSNSANNQLDHVIIEYGSAGGNGDANLVVFGQNNQISLTNSILRNSAGFGFEISHAQTTINAFYGNTITGNAIAGEIPASLVDKLKDASNSPSNFSGNTLDVIDATSDTLAAPEGMRWPNIGIDYRVGRLGNAGGVLGLKVESSLVIEPGVTLAMVPNSGIHVNTPGILRAEGTPELPIRITSANIYSIVGAFAGDWSGIQFTNSINNILDYTTVEFAGNPAGLNGDGNIVLYGNSPGSTVAITNCAIQDSLTAGVWMFQTFQTATGLSDGTNTFLRNAGGDIVVSP